MKAKIRDAFCSLLIVIGFEVLGLAMRVNADMVVGVVMMALTQVSQELQKKGGTVYVGRENSRYVS